MEVILVNIPKVFGAFSNEIVLKAGAISPEKNALDQHCCALQPSVISIMVPYSTAVCDERRNLDDGG